MSQNHRSKTRRQRLLPRLSGLIPATQARPELTPVPAAPSCEVASPAQPTDVPVLRNRGVASVPLHGVHATAVLPDLWREIDATEVLALDPVLTPEQRWTRDYAAIITGGNRLIGELGARYDVLLAEFDEQVDAEGKAWDAICAEAETEPDRSPLGSFGAFCDSVDRRIALWSERIIRYNRDRVNDHYTRAFTPIRNAFADLEMDAKRATAEAAIILDDARRRQERQVSAPTDSFPALTPTRLAALDAQRAIAAPKRLGRDAYGESSQVVGHVANRAAVADVEPGEAS